MAKITRDNPSKVIIVPRPEGEVSDAPQSGTPEESKAEEVKPETVEKEAPKKK